MKRQIAVRIRTIGAAIPAAATRVAAVGVLAAVAALVTLAGPGPGVSHAAQEPASRPATGSHDLQRNDMAVRNQSVERLIWSANLKVGKASDSLQSYMGYLPALSPPEGDLDAKEFTHNDVHYTILGVFQQEFGESVKQLVFNADAPLDDDLYFKAGNLVFPLSEAADLGSGRNIHAWRLEEALDWPEGEIIPVSLFKLVEQATPPDPTDGDDPEEFMLAVFGIAGELTESGQFHTIAISLEAGKAYMVEMKGSATGDGTLSDPWISGINGRFTVDGQSRWEPAWYDASGRTSEVVTFPGGTQYQVDENGRMFSSLTGSDGMTVLRPVTGGNDDGGEGFNARLFLVDFPEGDYQVVVSGAPNPHDTGTYTFSLMEVMSDDHQESPDAPGALTVGGSAVGNIEAPGDVDWFAVELEAGVEYTIHIRGQFSDAGTLADPRFDGIYDDVGWLLDDTWNDRRPPPRVLSDSRLTFTPTDSGTYHVAVSGYNIYLPHRSTLPVGTYTVSVEVPE